MRQLIHLDLFHAGIGAEGARALLSLPNLTYLNLDWNPITEAEAGQLGALTNGRITLQVQPERGGEVGV
jgi:hypothetical protein